MIAYLDQYAATFDLPIEFNSAVRVRWAEQNGAFRLEVGGRQIVADQVVVATGPFQRPRVPPAADQLAAEVFQTHSADYRLPSDVPDGRVLVVGGGNTGFQIAKDPVDNSHRAARDRLSPDAPATKTLRPRHFLVADDVRLLDKTVDSRLADGSATATRSSGQARANSRGGTASRSGRASLQPRAGPSHSPTAVSRSSTP